MGEFNEKRKRNQIVYGRRKVLARWSLGGKFHIAIAKPDGEIFFPCRPGRGVALWPIKRVNTCFGVHWNLRPGITKRTKICRTCLAMPSNELAIKMLHDPMFNEEKLLRITVMPGRIMEIIEYLERHPDVVVDKTRIVRQ